MGSILQTKQWADFKKSFGFEIISSDNLFVHKKQLPFGKNFLYVPEVSSSQISGNQVEQLKSMAKQHNSIFLRLELIDRYGDNANKILLSMGFKKSFEQVQPKWRQIVDLTPTRGTILSQMKQKGRYNVKLAQRKGVQIKRVSLKEFGEKEKIVLDQFFEIYNQTVKREGIGGRSREYFVEMAKSFEQTEYLWVYIAYFENKPLSAALISMYDGVASYLYGGSSSQNREVMAPYLMHWQIIVDAKEEGAKLYDLIGRSAPDNPGSKWAGITRFKEQFGGQAVEILGSYDFINSKFAYQVFKLIEKRRRSEA
ncbi:MAG: Lipid II:glycine glycyltransferase [candidate division WS2 bacterium ADurb.Bin280]|uniref:Lipid II:glycine glycyltransferase n=1 Tax=candidate division WS2 bacterium ADurb.Bin280 TaxID=1852829 RepID=A0A1V5SD38_9BACT|nr:MAG: Lipid II:glycine glycyltransferase [candidate division WS2 bacterium ADurb.Bin280]